MRPRHLALTLASCAAVLVSTWGWAQTPPGINKPFENPDVKEYIKKFETDSRELYAKRREVVRALDLKPGMAVADIGAGTGLFTRLIAEKVGPTGRVYAVDVSRAFLDHIAAESKRRGQSQVETIRGDQDSTKLPPDSVDLAFVCDVYHHFEHPSKVLASIHRALRPGGQLVVIEFDRVAGKSRAFILMHVRAGKAVFLAEIEAAGFQRIETPDAPTFRENFFARFRKRMPSQNATQPRSDHGRP